MRSAPHARAALLALTVLIAAAPLTAQQAGGARARARAETRLDYLGPNPHTLHAGLGMTMPLGTYLRLSLIGGGGASWRDGRSGGSFRADVVGRFTFDPFRERRWGLSAGGGLSVRYDRVVSGDQWRPLLALVIDVEGMRATSVAPAVQVGLGGGVRVGVALRGATPGRR